jgi:hypothetical protein
MEIFLIWLGFVRLKPREISTVLDQTRFDFSLVRQGDGVNSIFQKPKPLKTRENPWRRNKIRRHYGK